MQDISLLAAAATAVAAGVLSFLSPCVLPLMPAYLSYVTGMSLEDLRRGPPTSGIRSRRLWIGSLGFVGGFSAVFIALGASATVVGRLLSGLRFEVLGATITPVTFAGVVIIAFGLHLLGVVPIPWLYRERRLHVDAAGSALSAALLGAAFAFGWTPCIGPVLGGILTLAASQTDVGLGILLLALYSAGLALPFLAMSASLERFFGLFARVRPHFRAIEVGSGLLLLAVGLLVVSERMTLLNSYFGFLGDLVISLEEKLL
jgi:cytochrome c-type biogenesis protein